MTFLASLPDVPNIVYLLGFKFGSGSDWRRAFHLNCIVPYRGERYPESSIVVFSSTKPYGPMPYDPETGGATPANACAGAYSILKRVSAPARCASPRGFSLHAATRVGAAYRDRLERRCRYVNRPALAAGRLQLLDAE